MTVEPRASYRLQFGSGFGFADAAALAGYLAELGVSHVYASPYLASASGTHGYDVVDHGSVDVTFGDLEQFGQLAMAARDLGMGLLLDIIPNHMGNNDAGNEWWLDVLENGETSRYADFFDIDWNPTATNLQHKVLLPFLGAPFVEALEQAQLQVVYEHDRLQLAYGDCRFPLAPGTWPAVLEPACDHYREHHLADNEQDEASGDQIELESIITQLRLLPDPECRDEAATRQRYREQGVARRRLAQLLSISDDIRQSLAATLASLNGAVGQPRSFDRLEQLINRQWYRLAYWRVAADEINYRRFFDINDLAAIRVEVPRVFDAVHGLVGQFISQGWVTGLRIDHPDGLLDPQSYFENLHALFRRHRPRGDERTPSQIYLVAEKILSGEEPLPTDWNICGTTGYDLLNLLNRLLVHPEGLQKLRSAYAQLTGQETSPADVLYESKRTILIDAMSSELQMLARQLYCIAQQDRAARDYTLPGLQRALREVIACMTVYRTYVRPQGWDVSEADYRRMTTAVRMAKRRNPSMDWTALDFIASVVLLRNPPYLSEEQAADRRRFALKMQQVTGPVMAKGLEDTSFYRHYPLASLNEVGGELDTPAISTEEMHRQMHHRATTWPHSLSATSTHDTKRGEDVRARLHVLSEIPDLWIESVYRWQELNRPMLHVVDGEELPDRNTTYLLYQTLLGTWPLDDLSDAERETYVARIVRYMQKAEREAKVHTSWMNPAEEYEQAVAQFVQRLLTHESAQPFRAEMQTLASEIATAGFINALAQTLLKATLPGVPDFYQGTEYWDFNLVDPDNRRPLDFAIRRESLARLQQEFAFDPQSLTQNLIQRWPTPEIKQFVAWRSIAARAANPQLFSAGEYLSLIPQGDLAEHVFGFCRRWQDLRLAVIVPRQVQLLAQRSGSPDSLRGFLAVDWGNTRIELPCENALCWRNEFSGEMVTADSPTGKPSLSMAGLFARWPVVMLTARATPPSNSPG